jgi:polysaccharide deacetylase family protein (PEP-CTERM system associated)
MQKNILTCDLEDWYHTTVVNAPFDEWEQYPQRVEDSARRVLELLDRSNTKITFFVLGYVAEKFPRLIEEISREGHEIASHSYRHRLVYNLSAEEFQEDLRKSISVLASITGKEVKGFRAPSWSIHQEQNRTFEVLAQNDIAYDSSLYPFKTFLYGDNSYSRFGRSIATQSGKFVYEMPPAVGQLFGRRVPFGGGFYLRTLPYWMIKKFIRSFNKIDQPAMIYFHPWEIDTDQPRLDLNTRDRFIQYYNISTMEVKLTQLLKDYEFGQVEQILQNRLDKIEKEQETA